MTSEPNRNSDGNRDFPIRTAFQNFYDAYAASHNVSLEQSRAAACISHCKTGKFGYVISYCPECGFKKIHACSCNNRDCPSCQAPLEKKWVMERNAELVDGIAYYHVVFTLPHILNALILANQKLLYDLLFSAASDSLITLCRDRKYMGATPGIVSVLHTWGQQLNFHPHLHVCLSGGGLTPSGNFAVTRHKGFIIPKQVLGIVFRGKFLAGLKVLYNNGELSLPASSGLRNSFRWKEFLDHLYGIAWLPFIKETFNGNGNAVEYLARYAYRTAISNSRIIDVSTERVSFQYTDYADENKKKVLVLSGPQFIGRFLLHILPKGFHRVRFSGFLANCKKSKNLTHIGILRANPYHGNPARGLHMSDLIKLIYGTDFCFCPQCHVKMSVYRSRVPPEF